MPKVFVFSKKSHVLYFRFSGVSTLAVFLMAPSLLLLLMATGAAGASIINAVRTAELAYNGKHESVTTHRKYRNV